MKRPIKFRGRVPDTDKLDGGRIVYGSLVDYGEDDGLYRYWIHPIGGGGRNYFPVDEDSIAQLVGYDSAGNEVYEGDTVTITRSTQTYKVGTEFTARRGAYVVDDIRSIMHFISGDFKLKEDTK